MSNSHNHFSLLPIHPEISRPTNQL